MSDQPSLGLARFLNVLLAALLTIRRKILSGT